MSNDASNQPINPFCAFYAATYPVLKPLINPAFSIGVGTVVDSTATVGLMGSIALYQARINARPTQSPFRTFKKAMIKRADSGWFRGHSAFLAGKLTSRYTGFGLGILIGNTTQPNLESILYTSALVTVLETTFTNRQVARFRIKATSESTMATNHLRTFPDRVYLEAAQRKMYWPHFLKNSFSYTVVFGCRDLWVGPWLNEHTQLGPESSRATASAAGAAIAQLAGAPIIDTWQTLCLKRTWTALSEQKKPPTLCENAKAALQVSLGANFVITLARIATFAISYGLMDLVTSYTYKILNGVDSTAAPAAPSTQSTSLDPQSLFRLFKPKNHMLNLDVESGTKTLGGATPPPNKTNLFAPPYISAFGNT